MENFPSPGIMWPVETSGAKRPPSTCPKCGHNVTAELSAGLDACGRCLHTFRFCPHCSADVRESVLRGTACHVCGSDLYPDGMKPAPPVRPRWRQQKHRGLLWAVFWFLFLTTPVMALVMNSMMRGIPALRMFGPTLAPLGGIVAAGFVLAFLYSNSTGQLVRRTIGFSFLIGLIYGVILFAGCVLLIRMFEK
jgi:hypothetical protein